jgi:CheY-like chemotaxis protein
MVVDDDSNVRHVTASMLEDDLGYVVLQAGSGGAALDLVDRHPNVDLILLNLAMPGMSGLEVARQVELKYPAIPILFVTGYVDKSSSDC